HSLLMLWAIFVLVYDPPEYSILDSGLRLAFFGDVLFAGAALAALTVGWIKADVRARAEFVSLGAAVSYGPVCLLSFAPSLVLGADLVPPTISSLTMVVMPLAIGIGVTRYRFLGVTYVLQRGVIAIAVWVALLLVFATLDSLLEGSSSSSAFTRLLASPLGEVAVIAAVFYPSQRWLRRGIERLVLRD